MRSAAAMAVALALGLGLAAADANAANLPVAVEYLSYSPYALDAVSGDTVTWTNMGGRTHTVTADDYSFNSGDLLDGHTFSYTFIRPGAYTYHCIIHRGMYGEVDVRLVTLNRLPAAVAPKSRIVVSGRTADPATPVLIQTDTGAGFQTVTRATPQADGTWSAALTAMRTARVRALSDGGVSQSRQLLVVNRKFAVGVTRRGLTVHVAPANPGALVALQFLLRDRFGWWQVAVRRLDQGSNTTFQADRRHPVRARVVLLGPDHWTPLAISRVIRLRTGSS